MKQNVKSRQDKKAQFAKKTGQQATSGRRIPLLAALAVVAVIGLGLGIWAVTGASPDSRSVQVPLQAAPDSPTLEPLAPAPVAATVGHDPYLMVSASDGEIRLPTSLFADGEAHHFTYMHNGAPIEFFVLQSPDGVARAAFNACDVCFQAKRGYLQDGDRMVCLNCGRQFPSDQINIVEGGCNPAPLERSLQGDVLVLRERDVVLGARFF